MNHSRTKPDALTSSGVARIVVEPPPAGALPLLLEGELANRFEVRGEVARGGMGRIVDAWDARHERRVAIKLLLRRDRENGLRFAREARLTARLQHPGIIPVYESGYSVSGEPFYVMRFVEGSSLAHAVAQRPPFEERLSLLPHLVAVTDALAYAHARGIIHRDLKPANVLLGPFGESVVIDWGLAKETAEDETATAVNGAGGDPSLTTDGRAIGTPRFMPPEQARGEAADPRSDVYALGALLYFVLSGVPPYEGTTSEDVLSRVKEGPPRELAALEPRVPGDLAAIVAKAMARDAGARYPAAREMAADLKRFGAGQLVSVRHYSLGALLRRWGSRHKGVLSVSALLLTALAVGGALSVRRVVRERDRADASGRAFETQRDAAEQLVAFVISDLHDRLRAVGRLDVLAGVGKEVNGYYTTVAQLPQGADLGVIQRRAAALETLAEVEAARHEIEAARALYDAAERLRSEDATRRGTADAQAALAELLIKRSAFAWKSDRGATSASEPAARAVAIGDAIAARSPSNVAGLTVLARAHASLARVNMARGHFDEARPEITQAVSFARRLVDAEPGSPVPRRLLADTLTIAADLDEKTARPDTRAADEAIALLGEIVAAAPEDADALLALSKAYDIRSRSRGDARNVVAALDDATRMLELRTRLADRDPANVEWQQLLGQAYEVLSGTQQLANLDGVPSSQKSVEILAKIAARTPDAPSVQDDLLLAYQRLGWVLERVGRFDEAAVAIAASLRIAERFMGSADGERFRGRLADGHGLLGDILVASGKREEARGHMRSALAILEASGDTSSLEARKSLIFSRLGLADLEDRDPAEAKRLKLGALRLFVRTNLDNNEEPVLLLLSKTCVALLPSADPSTRETVAKAIGILEPIRIDGADPKPRLAALAEAKRRLGP